MPTYYVPASQLAQLRASRRMKNFTLMPVATISNIWTAKMDDPETLAWNGNYLLQEHDTLLMRDSLTGAKVEATVEALAQPRGRRYGEN